MLEHAQTFERKNPYILAIGGAGCRFYRFFVNRYWQDNLITCNTDKEGLENIPSEQAILYGEDICMGKGCGGDVTLGEKVFAEHFASFSRLFFSKEREAFIIAGLGGGTGTGAIRCLCSKLKGTLDHRVTLFLIHPFTFEKEPIIEAAEKTIPLIEKAGITFKLFYNDEVLSSTKKEVPIKEAMQEQFNRIADTMCETLADTT